MSAACGREVEFASAWGSRPCRLDAGHADECSTQTTIERTLDEARSRDYRLGEVAWAAKSLRDAVESARNEKMYGGAVDPRDIAAALAEVGLVMKGVDL